MNIFTRFGEFLLMLKGMFTKPENWRMYWKELMHQCVELGIGSLGIVALISFFTGAVSTVQTAYQFVSPLLPRSIIAQIVRDTVILEFAPTITCIVLAGVVGSKISSELGNMRVTEQIDALEIMGYQYKGLSDPSQDIGRLDHGTLAGDRCHGFGYMGWKDSR